MAITRRPQAGLARVTVEQFISAAPDAAHDVALPTKRRKETISLGVDPLLLEKIDALANRSGISRAAAIALAMYKLVEEES